MAADTGGKFATKVAIGGNFKLDNRASSASTFAIPAKKEKRSTFCKIKKGRLLESKKSTLEK